MSQLVALSPTPLSSSSRFNTQGQELSFSPASPTDYTLNNSRGDRVIDGFPSSEMSPVLFDDMTTTSAVHVRTEHTVACLSNAENDLLRSSNTHKSGKEDSQQDPSHRKEGDALRNNGLSKDNDGDSPMSQNERITLKSPLCVEESCTSPPHQDTIEMANPNENTFSHADILTLRHDLIGIVQERSLWKHRLTENEAKIHELVSSVSVLEKDRDTLQQKLKQQQASFDGDMLETKLSLEVKLGKIEMEERYRKIVTSRQEEQYDQLRQEATNLQLLNYRQEQKIQELETKLKSQESAASQSTAQWLDFQKRLAHLTTLYNEAQSSVERLELSGRPTGCFI